jgi:hypothetical protein
MAHGRTCSSQCCSCKETKNNLVSPIRSIVYIHTIILSQIIENGVYKSNDIGKFYFSILTGKERHGKK